MARTDGLSQEDQRAVFRSVRENMRELAPLLQSERQRAITELARGIGYSDSEAANFAEYIREVYEITSSGPLFRTTGGRGGSWGGGGGGPRPQR